MRIVSPADSLSADSLAADSLSADSLAADSLSGDSLAADSLSTHSASTILPLERKLLDGFQRGFPIVERPFAAIGQVVGATEADVIEAVERLLARRVVSRVGAVFAPGRAGASTLAAVAIPEADVEAVAGLVGSFPDVNHSYLREHRLNLWFVVTSRDADRVSAVLDDLRAQTGLEILDLPIEEPYHLDLGFALKWPEAVSAERSDAWGRRDAGAPELPGSTNGPGAPASRRRGRNEVRPCSPLGHAPIGPPEDRDRRVLAALQDGLQPVSRPFEALGGRAGMPEAEVIALLDRLLEDGLVKRLGLVVRHHEMGYRHNAMVVFDVPDDAVGSKGRAVAASGLATLCYRRSRRMPQWPYNLYLMVHARSRSEALSDIETLRETCALADSPHEILFCMRRFKQQGARYFDADA